MKTILTTAWRFASTRHDLTNSLRACVRLRFFALALGLGLATSNALSQGTIVLGNNVSGGILRARIYMPDPTYPFWPTFGNTTNDIPAGTQTYSGAPTSSYSDLIATLWAAPGANQPESALQLATGTAITFRSGSASGFFNSVTATLPNVPADCPVATVQVRVWQAQYHGNWVPTWDAARYSIPGNLLGKSLPFNVEAIGGGTNPPPNLLNLRSFSLITNLFDSGSKPLIYVQPQHHTVSPGGTVAFRAEVSCPVQKSAHWRFNGSNIVSGWGSSYQPLTNAFTFPMFPEAGGTLVLLTSSDFFLGFPETNILQLTNVQVSQAGIYSLVVSNRCCFYPGMDSFFTVSSNAVLTVGNPGPLSVAHDSAPQIVLNWEGVFFLQSATNLAGPFTDLPGPIVFGPYTNAESSGQRFFRLRN